MKYLFCLCLITLFSHITYSQERKSVAALRTETIPRIDGIFEEEIWGRAPVAGDFVEMRPSLGRKERTDQKTEVRILYDNTAIYVFARMNDTSSDSIAYELSARDRVGNADFFGIMFDTYFDKINAVGFYITSAGSQYDAKYSQSGNEDDNWNAVWESGSKIDNKGWTAEFRIPYSALRFAGTETQLWGLNMTRRRQKTQQQLFWNAVDPKVDGFINQEGELRGISNITPPLRLSFSPYISGYANHYPNSQAGAKDLTNSFNGGMDLKYGINESFTLDMTLIPDFGQVQSDNQVLNLSPFEVQYNERRQFFTEGTELFNKGNLFYSRRIGGAPINSSAASKSLQPGEKIISNPSESKLLNAAKISGRTNKGLGIGFFNAITNKMQATIEGSSGMHRFLTTQPLTNFNIVVLDQTLKNNSSLSFINTNVFRAGSVYDANVSALVFNLNDKKNIWNVNGAAKISSLGSDKDHQASTGYNSYLRFGKQSGKFEYNYSTELMDDKYNPKDLGIISNNNYFEHSLFGEMNLYNENKIYNELHSWISLQYSERYKPRSYQSFGIYSGFHTTFKNLWYFNLNMEWLAASNDFYEARNGLVFKKQGGYRGGIDFGSNRSKAYNYGGYGSYRYGKLLGFKAYNMGFYQNLRISSKFNIGNDFRFQPEFNQAGWAGTLNGSTIFSRFNRKTIENSFDATYNINNKMGFTFYARHYWSDRNNRQFYYLQNGSLEPGAPGVNADRNFNTFNIDMNFAWQFSPGSELTVAWKDASLSNENSLRPGYGKNFNHILEAPQNNSLSLKVLYYIDYLQLKRR